jgi:hypothetical protein
VPQIYGLVNTPVPAAGADGTQSQVRASRYGEPYVLNPLGPGNTSTLDGYSFVYANPTMGTGIAMGIQTTFSATANVLCIIRNTAAGGGRSTYLRYIRLINTVTGATTSASDIACTIDTANRYSSGGTQLVAGNNYSGSANVEATTVHFGACTAAAVVTPRVVGRAKLKVQAATCWTIGDEVLLTFGGADAGGSGAGFGTGLFATAVVGAVGIHKAMGPVVLGPGNNHSFLLHMWNTANATTAPSWEVEVGLFER